VECQKVRGVKVITVFFVVCLAIIIYEWRYDRYKNRVLDFILRSKSLENIYEEVREKLPISDKEILEVRSYYYNLDIDGENIREYYETMIEEADLLEKEFLYLDGNLIYTMDDDLYRIVCAELERTQYVRSRLKYEMWLNG